VDDRYNREERRDGGTWGDPDPKDVPTAEEFPWQESSGSRGGTGWDTPAAEQGSSHPPQQPPVGQGAGSAAPAGNGMAVAGFVLSILALILCWLSLIDLFFILPAIVFSAIGLRRANKQARPHRGLAIAGLSISLVATVIMIVFTIIWLRVADDITDDWLPTIDPPAPAPPARTPPPDDITDDSLPTVDPPAPAPPARTPPPDDITDELEPPEPRHGVLLSGNVLTLEDEFFGIHLEVEVVGITRGYPGNDSFLEPGNEWVRIVLEVKNLSRDDHRFHPFNFNLVDANGEAFFPPVGYPDTGDLIKYKTIPARSVTRGDVVRQAPISDSQMTLAVDVFAFDTQYLPINLDSQPTVDPPAPAPRTAPAPEPPPPAQVPAPPVMIGDCREGMTLQPGEACRYTGDESPPAEVVLSASRDGGICREGGPVERFGGTIERVRLCTDGFDWDDTFKSNIRVRQNADNSWTVTSSR